MHDAFLTASKYCGSGLKKDLIVVVVIVVLVISPLQLCLICPLSTGWCGDKIFLCPYELKLIVGFDRFEWRKNIFTPS